MIPIIHSNMPVASTILHREWSGFLGADRLALSN